MDRILVNSTNITAVGYDHTAQTLEVEFRQGGIYQYLAVPESIYQSFMMASSKGEFFHDHILKEFDFQEV